MRARTWLLLAAVTVAGSTFGSTLRVAVEHHISSTGPFGSPKVMRSVFAEETLTAEIHLDIYAVPQLPSSSEGLAELRALPDEGWWKALEWHIVDTATGRELPKQPWKLVRSSVEKRGPWAGDTSTVVDWRTLSARFALPAGALPPGDYSVAVSMSGLVSALFPFAVRTGEEADVRDAYLATLASRAGDFPTYRRLQLERAQRDPMKAAALLQLAERSTEEGTLQETLEYYTRAIAALRLPLEQYGPRYPEWAKREATEIAERTAQVRAIQRVLPEYFQHRNEWQLVYDTPGRRWVIRSRKERQILREIPRQ